MPTKPKKKPSKKKQVLRDESPESKGEPKNRQVSIKIRTPRVVVIQEPLNVPVKKTQESSRKLKGIEMLSEAAQLELATHKAIKDSQRTSRLKHKIGSSSKGISVSPGVLDELTRVLAVSSEGVGTSPKTNKDGDEDDVNEEEEDEEESVDEEESFNEKENVDEENEKESDDDDMIFDITNTDIVAETEEEENADSKHEEDDTKGEDKKTEEEPKGDDQAKKAEVGVPDLATNKEKSEFLQSTFSHSISSNFGNQFLVNSPNASLIGTIPENTDKKITFMMDIVIQQDVPLVQNEPFHEIKVSVIPEPTQQPSSTPPLPAKEDPTALVINFEAVDSFLHKFNDLKNDIQELKQADHFAAILESIRSQKEEYKDFIQETVANEVKNQLSQILPKGKSLTKFELKKILMEKMKRGQSYQTVDQHKILYNGLVNSYLLDKDLFESYGQTVSLKRNHEEDKDEDTSTRPNQGKEMEKRRIRKETESSKKSSTPKESTKGKPSSKSSKTGQSAHADQSAKEPEHEIPNQGFQSQTGSLNLQDLRHLNQIRTLSRPLVMLQNSHVFFNNDLEYLKGDRAERTYSSSITKTPAASVVSVQVEKKFSYGYLKEIVVKRADQQLYKFKEGDFPYLHPNNIEDMLLFLTQNMLFNLDGDVIVDLGTSKKLSPAKEPYTPNYDPQRVIYEDKEKRKRLMRVDELHKFLKGHSNLFTRLFYMDSRTSDLNTIAILICQGDQSNGGEGSFQDESDSWLHAHTYILLKLKNFKKDEYSRFQDKEMYEHVSPKVIRSQEGKRLQDDEKR
ncbi:hypothetical protein Tco_0883138 [Tanacetum coccineum]